MYFCTHRVTINFKTLVYYMPPSKFPSFIMLNRGRNII